ncbi:zinc finger, CCHC-type containing protein, partial [Tanacetum coccineum]
TWNLQRSYEILLNPSTWQMMLSSKKFLVSNFNNYKMVDSRPVMEQFNELLRILGQYTQHGFKHGKDDLSLVQLGSHLRIEESLRAQKSNKGKGKEVVRPSMNMMEEGGKNKKIKQRKETWIVVVETKRIMQVLVVREKGLRTNTMTKVNAIAWWIDSGATNHVCKDRCWFKTYEPMEDRSVLYMGDGHFSPVQGKGRVVLEFSSGKSITLFNVLYVPKLRIIHETTAPYTPQQNGMAERKNRALKEMVNAMLSYSGLSDGFWGEAMLTACYLLNRAVVRLPNSKRKTLSEKCIDCIFVGYAKHFKAYSFYVIEANDFVSINTIIKSRDAIFDENHFSSISRPKDIIPNSKESQKDDHSNDVPSETPEPRKGERARKAK